MAVGEAYEDSFFGLFFLYFFFFGRWHLGCFQDSKLWSHRYFHCKQCFLWTILQQWNRIAATEGLQSLQLEIKQWVPQQSTQNYGKQLRENPASNEGWVLEFLKSCILFNSQYFFPCMFEYIIWMQQLKQLNLRSSWQIPNGWGRNEKNIKKVVIYIIWYTMQVECQSVSKRNMFLLSLKKKNAQMSNNSMEIFF